MRLFVAVLSAGEEVSDGAYRQAIKVISAQLLHDYSPQHYLIINVSEPRSDLIRLNSNASIPCYPRILGRDLAETLVECMV